MNKTWLLAVFILYTLSAPECLELGPVTRTELNKIADPTTITEGIRGGLQVFLREYADVAAKNKEWLDKAVITANASHLKDESFDMYVLQLEITNDDKTETFLFRTNPDKLTHNDYAQAIRNLIYAIGGFPAPRTEQPILVRRFGISAFLADISYGSMLPATSIACMSDGRIVIGHSMYATVVDPMLRISDTVGKKLSESGKYTGYNLRASQSGTLLANLSGSGDVLLFNLPETQPRTVATGLSSIESYAWLGDGTLVAKEMMTGRVVAVEQKKKRTLVLQDLDSRYEQASLAAGPDGSLISFNPGKRFISWYDKNGNLLKRIIPCLSETQFGTIRAIAWTGGGNFFVTATNYVCMIDLSGSVLWNIPLDPILGMMIYEAAWSEKDQSAYMIFPGSKTVGQYMDAAHFRSLPEKSEWRKFRELDQTLAEESDSTDAIKLSADLYLSLRADAYALSLYESYNQIEAGDREVEKTIARLKADRLLAMAALYETKVRATIRDIGPESAKTDYSAAMGNYEQALAQKPGDQKIIQARAALAKTMREAESGINTPAPPLTLEDSSFPPIFPALLATYSTTPVGKISIHNTTGQKITQVRASFFIPRFMDYPSESEVIAAMEKDTTFQLPLYATFNPGILNIEEDLPIQALLTVTWKADGLEQSATQSLEKTQDALIYRRTALSWDDSGKLASFITPNEETVNRLAMTFLDSITIAPGSGVKGTIGNLSKRIQRASAIISGLATMKLKYLEDPQSPLSAVMGKGVVVDTVRFPRTTLFFRNGDCDDTTALLSSLLEAAGIPTAILTTPGHVFLAINTGIPAAKQWMIEPLGSILSYKNEVWIPLESTALDGGFGPSWQEASRLVKKWKDKAEFEFLPLTETRTKYPPIPLPPSVIPLELPSSGLLTKAWAEQDTKLTEKIYATLVEALSKPVKDIAEEVKRLNRLGIVHGIFENYDAASRSFLSALKISPEYRPAALNLANLAILSSPTGTERKGVLLAGETPPSATLSGNSRSANATVESNWAE